MAEKLARLKIFNVVDLIYYFPRKWEDFGKVIPINKIKPDSKITIKAQLTSLSQFISPIKKMSITNAIFQDDSGALKVTWFNQPYISKNLEKQKTYLLAGTAKLNNQTIGLTNPTIEPADKSPIHSGGIIPVYPMTEGVTSKFIRKTINYLTTTIKKIPETLTQKLITDFKLTPLPQALTQIHSPKSIANLKTAQKRLSLEELLPIQLSILISRQLNEQPTGQSIAIDNKIIDKFINQLNFKLTPSQKTAIDQILKDMQNTIPMNRLLMGDVGSGKTIVAAASLLATSQAGFQSAFMAPTEVLAHQHYDNLRPLLNKWDINVSLLTANQKINSENLGDVVIGTHSLIQENVDFKNLGLIIIDEQHRFGVRQRQVLKDKNPKFTPHFLSLSATPIPRTLFLGLLQDLDISWLDSLPRGRLPVITKLISSNKDLDTIKSTIEQEIKNQHKIFIIAPLIDIGTSNKTSITEEQKRIAKLFPKARIDVLHGRMSSQDKLQVMENLSTNKTDILVATSVIEVGIDIPDASVVWIKNAESFGLSQLHQLRGRVGRSDIQSYCFIESDSATPQTLERLQALAETTDGNKLAEIDLKLRGPGVFFKDQQSGFAKLQLADLTNIKLIKESRKLATSLLELDPTLEHHPYFKKQIELNYLTHQE